MKLKKLSAFALSLLAVGALVSCVQKTETPTPTPTDKTEEKTPTPVTPTPTPTPTETPETKVMTYSEYLAAENGDEVTISGYVQAKQAWWSNKATIYLQDDDGAYFLYELGCTEEQYNTDLAIGNHIKVTGIKDAWAGMIEVVGQTAGAEATYEVLEGSKVYNAKPQSSLENEALIALPTQKVSFTNLTVVSVELPESEGKDIYYDVTDGTNTLTFAVESYLTSASTDVYKAAMALKAGDKINCEGFMYVYNNAQLHTTSISTPKPEGILSYAEYAALEDGEEVTISGYVQAKQAWWSNKATIYLQDDDGAYFLYELGCTEEQFNTDLAIGNHIKVTGVKGSWAGMVEILGQSAGAEATYEVLEGTKIYDSKAQDTLNNALLISLSTQKVSFADLTVLSVELPASEGKDIYFDVTDGKNVLTFAVESYLTSSSTDVYQAAMALKVGDVISCEGFMYVYYNAQLHTTSLTVTKATDILTYAEYVAAEEGTEVTIAGYVQAKQAWWDNKATVYLQDDNGAYFLYELGCTEEQFNTDLAIGNHIKVTGIKDSWAGMVEILGQFAGAEATYEVLPDNKVYEAKVQESLNNEELIALSTQKVSFTNLTVVSVELPASEGKDIYFDVTDGTTTLTFAVESYLTDASTDVYKTVLTLKAGDKINCEGFMYVYNNAQLHTTSVTVVTE